MWGVTDAFSSVGRSCRCTNECIYIDVLCRNRLNFGLFFLYIVVCWKYCEKKTAEGKKQKTAPTVSYEQINGRLCSAADDEGM